MYSTFPLHGKKEPPTFQGLSGSAVSIVRWGAGWALRVRGFRVNRWHKPQANGVHLHGLDVMVIRRLSE